MYSASYSGAGELARLLRETTAPLRVIAHVLVDERAEDLAIILSGDQLAVIRCAARVSQQDHVDLTTMLNEDDFAWAGLVFPEQLHADWPGLIEAFHVSELPRLVERLQELQKTAAS